MHPDFQQLMRHATRLTQSGDLAAATAAIQAALRGGAAAAATDTATATARASAPAPATEIATRQDESNIIDVEVRQVPESADALAPSPAAAAAEDIVCPTPTHAPHVRGDAFLAGSFRHSAGQRSYKLYVPPNAGDRPMPLVVMLHGCTQDADDFAAGTAMNDAARAQGFYVLYPVQSREANPQKCWNWFKHNHQQPGRGEPAILEGMTRSVMDTYAIDPRRVYVAGLSAGGAMAAILANAYPGLYAAAGVHSGLAPGVAADLPSALAAMKGGGRAVSSAMSGSVLNAMPNSMFGSMPNAMPNSTPGSASSQAGSGVPTIVFHGDRDATVHPGNGQQVALASAGASAQVETLRVAGMNHRRDSTRHSYRNPAGDIVAEYWEIHGAGHAWAGGTANGSYTDQSGPDASAEMLRFFFERALASKP